MALKKFKVKDYVNFVLDNQKNGSPYWYGTYGALCTASLLAGKTKQYPSHYTSSRMTKYRKDITEKKHCADCVGAVVKWPIWSDLGAHALKYASNGMPDTSANGYFTFAKKQGVKYGKIATIPKNQAGIHVRFDGHIGLYLGNGTVVEWRGFSYGSVITKLADRKWTDWFESPFIDYEEDKNETHYDADAEHKQVKVKGGKWYVRTGPAKTNKAISVVKEGTLLPYQGVEKDGWYLVEYKGQNAWISSKGAMLA